MSDSDSDLEVIVPEKRPSKRRRIIDPTSISTVPIYSNKVNRCLQLRPEASVLAETNKAGDNAELNLWSPPTTKMPRSIELSEEEEEEEEPGQEQEDVIEEVYISSSPPPPPSESPSRKVSRRVNRKISEVNRKLDAVGSLLSPSPETTGRRSRQRRSPAATASPAAPLHEYDEDDDIIIMTSNSRPRVRQPAPAKEGAGPTAAREIPLKFRCRTDLHKILVLSSAPLSKAVDELSVKLKVPPSRILLLRKDMELPTHSTVTELGLGIADIIDCVVTAADNKQTDDSDIITVRLQGKEKASSQEYSIHREATLGSILSQYLSNMAANARNKVHFRYDGSKVTHSQTPAQLDMEDGDVIEVWT